MIWCFISLHNVHSKKENSSYAKKKKEKICLQAFALFVGSLYLSVKPHHRSSAERKPVQQDCRTRYLKHYYYNSRILYISLSWLIRASWIGYSNLPETSFEKTWGTLYTKPFKKELKYMLDPFLSFINLPTTGSFRRSTSLFLPGHHIKNDSDMDHAGYQVMSSFLSRIIWFVFFFLLFSLTYNMAFIKKTKKVNTKNILLK